MPKIETLFKKKRYLKQGSADAGSYFFFLA
jgi:hypothetical protein